MWQLLNAESTAARDKLANTLERWLLERFPSVRKRERVFYCDRRDSDYLAWLYYEGLLGKDESDGLPAKCEPEEIEIAVCVIFGFAVADQFGLEWVCKKQSQNEFLFGVRFKGSDCVLPLHPRAWKRIPIRDLWSEGEEPSFSNHMYEIEEVLEKGEDALREVIEQLPEA